MGTRRCRTKPSGVIMPRDGRGWGATNWETNITRRRRSRVGFMSTLVARESASYLCDLWPRQRFTLGDRTREFLRLDRIRGRALHPGPHYYTNNNNKSGEMWGAPNWFFNNSVFSLLLLDEYFYCVYFINIVQFSYPIMEQFSSIHW